MPKVAVIIPCFNQGEFLNEAVDSALQQTFDDFEIIVVDDGSTDTYTKKLLADYQRPNTRVLRTENRGLASARNSGIRETQAEYMLPLDADDRIGKKYLEEAVSILDNDPNVGIVYALSEFFGDRNGPNMSREFSLAEMLHENLIFCSALFRKSDWQKVGGYSDRMKFAFEDWDFWLSVLELGRGVHRLPTVHFYYRHRSNSMLSNVSIERMGEMYALIVERHPDLFQRNLKDVLRESFIDRVQLLRQMESMDATAKQVYDVTQRLAPPRSRRRRLARYLMRVLSSFSRSTTHGS